MSQGRSREVTATNTIKETRRNDERGARARCRGIAEISGSADGVARLVSHQVRLEHSSSLAAFDGRSLGACFADVQWVISAYVISERETAPMHAQAPAKMPCKLNRLPRPALTAKSPVKI